MRRLVVITLTLALANPGLIFALEEPGGGDKPNHSGSAQPFVGFYTLGPFILNYQGRQLQLQVSIKFKPEYQAVVSSGELGRAERDRLQLKVYEASLASLSDAEGQAPKEALRQRIRVLVDELLGKSVVEDVVFPRFSLR